MHATALPRDFSLNHTSRTVAGLGDKPALQVLFKEVVLALFVDEKDENTLTQRALDYINTYGYLAEWTRQKLVGGVPVSWTESMRVSLE